MFNFPQTMKKSSDNPALYDLLNVDLNSDAFSLFTNILFYAFPHNRSLDTRRMD